ncbi:hypothetical protein RI129_003880 [Pyrocoelia pectoralis]|uniref:Uncharacterized protein n=1 Tax=Pyrocoelia pectoralis TaxID=417401 RepID=A0AAN7VT60_9COLE
MNIEIFILVAIIVIFFASCCGFLQKIREYYEGNPPIASTLSQSEEQITEGVFPASFSPPPNIDYLEPPPKYEDLIKENQITIAFPQIERNEAERSQDNSPNFTAINIR